MKRTYAYFQQRASSSTPVALPASAAEWRELLSKALALRTDEIRLPPQFSIVNTETGDFIEQFGDPKSTQLVLGDPAKQRRSGVMVSLMPAPTATQTGPYAAAARRVTASSTTPAVFSREGQPPQAGRPADDTGVAFTGMDLVFPVTMRTSKLRAHSGQMSFPGGRCDGAETDVQAAIRESEEEIALSIPPTQVVGRTSQLYSFPSKSFVSPVVSLLDAFVEPRIASADEVESIHLLSFGALLCDTAHHHRVEKGWKETGPMRMPCFYEVEGNQVWGLTAFCVSELIGRVTTVMGSTPLVPDEVLRGWKDARLVPYRYVKMHNPYEHVWTSPLK